MSDEEASTASGCVPIGAHPAIWIFPILWTALTSLKPPGGLTGLTPKFVFSPTIDNYIGALPRPALRLLPAQQPARRRRRDDRRDASLMPRGLHAVALRIRGREQIGMWILSLRMLPPIVVIVPFYLIFNEADLLDTYGLLLVYMSFSLPFAIWLLTGFFAEVPRRSTRPPPPTARGRSRSCSGSSCPSRGAASR